MVRRAGPKSKTLRGRISQNLGDATCTTNELNSSISNLSIAARSPEHASTRYGAPRASSPPTTSRAAAQSRSRARSTQQADDTDNASNLSIAARSPTRASTSRAATLIRRWIRPGPPSGAARRKQPWPTTLRNQALLMQSTEYQIPKAPFGRLVREIMRGCSQEVTLITIEALKALQTSTEMYMEQRLGDAYLLTLHRGRVTLMVKDLVLVNVLRARF